MKDLVQKAIEKIEENDWLEILRKCQNIKQRLDKLMEFIPEIWLWDPTSARQLVFYLQRTYKIDFGVCDFYNMEGDRQYCNANGDEVECLCAIPQAYCVFRDKDGKPKHPEFLLIRSLEKVDDCREALEILSEF